MPQAFGRAPGVARRARRRRGTGGLRRRDDLPGAVGGLHAADPQPGPAAVEPGPAARTLTPRPLREQAPPPPPPPDAATEAVQILRTYPRSCPRATTSPRPGSAAWRTRNATGRRARPTAGLPRGPVPLVGGGRPALRQGPAREPELRLIAVIPMRARRGRRPHAAAAALRAQAGDGPPARGGRRPGRRLRAHQRGGLPDLRALQGLRHRRRVGQRGLGQLQPPLVVERLRGRLRRAGHPDDRSATPATRRATRSPCGCVASWWPSTSASSPTTCPTTPTRCGTSWRQRPRRSTSGTPRRTARAVTATCRAQGPAQGHLGALAATLRGVVGRRRRRATARPAAPTVPAGAEPQPSCCGRPRLYDLFDPDGTVLRDDEIWTVAWCGTATARLLGARTQRVRARRLHVALGLGALVGHPHAVAVGELPTEPARDPQQGQGDDRQHDGAGAHVVVAAATGATGS